MGETACCGAGLWVKEDSAPLALLSLSLKKRIYSLILTKSLVKLDISKRHAHKVYSRGGANKFNHGSLLFSGEVNILQVQWKKQAYMFSICFDCLLL